MTLSCQILWSRHDIERNVIEAGSRKITGKHREVIFLPQISVC